MAHPSTSKPVVLLIEDEEDVLHLVRYNLTKAGFRVVSAGDGLAGLAMAREHAPDAIVLDLMIPEMDGSAVCRELKSREATARIPVIMLTAKALEKDRVAGLKLGADDYVTKPFSPRELVLRLQAVLRRSTASGSSESSKFGPIDLDRARFEVTIDGETKRLSVIEFKLLVYFLERQGKVIDRRTLLREVWGYNQVTDSRTVDTYLRRLRIKLGRAADYLETVRGEGYRLRLPQDD